MKVILAIAAIAVAAAIAIIGLGSAGGEAGPSTSSTSTPESSPWLTTTPTPAPTATPVPSGQDDPTLTPTQPAAFASQPGLIAEVGLDQARAPFQQRLFKTPDGTMAVLYHRPGGPRNELIELVLAHSHDGGQTWHGETVLGTEAYQATYSGVMDSKGNLYVAYGKDGEGASGGAIKLRTLRYGPEAHGWAVGPEQRVVWDWPDNGASNPVLALTGQRLWLAYRGFKVNRYALYVQYADPDSQGDYPAGAWSQPYALTSPMDTPLLYPLLVTHASQLSAFFVENRFLVQWRLLADPLQSPEEWTQTQTVFNSPEPGLNGPKFAVAAGEDGRLHLVFGLDSGQVGYMAYDGRTWSRARLLAGNGAYWPVVATTGGTVWALWEKWQGQDFSYVEVRKWTPEGNWDRTPSRPWSLESERPFDAVWLYQQSSDSYSDLTRHAASPVRLTAGNVARGDIDFLPAPGDALYLGHAQPFDRAGFSLARPSGGDLALTWEYWDGSRWAPLATPPQAAGSLTQDLSVVFSFSPPTDWTPTEVNGYKGYFLRLRRESEGDFSPAEVAQVMPVRSLRSPVATVMGQQGNIDVLWTEDIPGGASWRLWHGSLSLETLEKPSSVPAHTHESTGPDTSAPAPVAVEPLHGATRQYIKVTLEPGQTYEYQLLDGQVRHITLQGTRLAARGPKGITLWATATVEVSGPGLEPRQQEIPAAYFSPPVILHGVRIWVEITEEFSDARLRDGGGVERGARLMLSDARYSLTDIDIYRWPFPGRLWGLGFLSTYYQGLQGSPDDPNHHGAFDQGMPRLTPVHAWHTGKLTVEYRGFDWVASISNAVDGDSIAWHRVLHLDNIAPEMFGAAVKPGDIIGYAIGDGDHPLVHWGGGSFFDWIPVLAEWYVAQSTPRERSYVKDWLVLGPFHSPDDSTRLSTPYIPDEATVQPQVGDSTPDGLTWRRWDAIVPGVVDVGEALSEFPNSGWARMNGNYPFSAAYFATYVYSPVARDVLINLGSSDAVKVWVGDQAVLERNTFVRVRSLSDWTIIPDIYQVKVPLEPGWNRVLLKLGQGENNYREPRNAEVAWQLTFRISDENGDPIPDLVISPERDISANPLANYVVTATDPLRVPPATAPTLPPQELAEFPLSVDAQQVVHDFSPGMRGLAMNNWNWLPGALQDNSALRSALAEVVSFIRPGIIRIGGGLWVNSMGWDRSNTAPDDGDWTWTDPSSGRRYGYRHAYKPSLIDAYAQWVRAVGAQTMVQVNLCDDNPGMWADLVRYTNVEHDYDFAYWELGNEIDQTNCVTADEYARRFAEYSRAMKEVDPSIKIIGPTVALPQETQWFDTLFNRLGRSLDGLSWHWYQLTEWTSDTSTFAYQGGSVEALLEYDKAIGTECAEGFGCPGDVISQDRLARMVYRRGMAEAMMQHIKKSYLSSSSDMETAITELGVHCCQHEHPINSNHIAAIWLADVLARWAYNGLDMATYYSLEDGGTGLGNSRGLAGIWDTGIIDIRPIYYTMFMYGQFFGDQMVESATADPDQKVVVWASRDSKAPGTLKLMLINLRGEIAHTRLNISGFTPAIGYAYEMTSVSPLSLEAPDSFTRHGTTINGQALPDYNMDNPAAFRNAVASIQPRIVQAAQSFKYDLQPYSVVALVLNDSALAPPPQIGPAARPTVAPSR